jgi:hypothetical protein
MNLGSSVVRPAAWATDLYKKNVNSKIGLRTTGGRSAYHHSKSTVLKQSKTAPLILLRYFSWTLRNECTYIKHNCMWNVPTQDRRVVLALRRPTRSSILGLRQQKQITRPIRPYGTSTVRQRGRFFMHRWLRDEKNANAGVAISVPDTRSKCKIIPISLFLIQNLHR